MEDEAGLEMVDLRDFRIDERLKKMLEENWGITQLFPPQARALPNSLDGRNLMLAIPTASGKSLVAHITMAHRLSNDLKGMRGVYIVPLKALASEKFRELSEICKSVDLKVGLAIGDRSSENNFVEDSDVLVCTSEKLDSMLRSNPSLMDDIGIVVADEFHLLQDPSRGPTLEILLSRIRHRVEGAQILALSATVGNANDLAEWLDADLVKSEWRPIALYSGTLTGLDLRYHSVESPGGDFSLPESKRLDGGVNKNLHSVLDDTTEMSKQMLVFVASRSSAQKEARELSKHVKSKLDAGVHNFSDSVTESWDEMANSLSVRESGSVTAKALANAVRGGVGFHHAGLTSSQRRVVEEGFRTGNLLCIVATPTLAQGVNLPASRVVIRDSRRWSTVAARSMPLPVMEVRQMMGRAGRPGFDEFGESFLVSKSKQDEDSLIDLYLKGEPEDVTSKLANPGAQNAEEDGALLAHILSIVATAGIDDRDAISRFLTKTFLSSQMNPETLEARTDDVLYWLCENGMIERRGESKQVENRIKQSKTAEREEDWQDEMPSWANSATAIPGLDLIPKEETQRRFTPRRGPAIFGFKKASMYKPSDSFIPEPATMTYAPTQLGARVSRLYLNPISGRIIQDGLRKAIDIISGKDNVGQVSPLSLLHLASCTPDFLPLWPRKNDYGAIQEVLHGREREFLSTTTDLEEERRMKGALVVNSWMDEDSLDSIENDWGVQAGDLRSRVELIEWLLYAMRRILSEDEDLGMMDRSAHKILYESIDEVHRRVRYGCKADILGLVAIRGVGRVRAREMSDTLGVNDASDLSAITERDKSRLSDLRGWSPKLVDKLVDSANKAVRRSR
ncbi:MAG: DEAD/DEAH box helicase [Candidatus Thalassarchaeaceae archaeon]